MRFAPFFGLALLLFSGAATPAHAETDGKSAATPAPAPALTPKQTPKKENIAEILSKWGLIGPWKLDCSAPPDRNTGAVLAYEVVSGGRVMHRRNFGDVTDESEVLSAKVSSDGMLNLRIYFPSLKQTRLFGFVMQSDGTIRAMYNRNEKNEYTIKDGKLTANGNPSPSQHKCK